jgi:hypothetical protein
MVSVKTLGLLDQIARPFLDSDLMTADLTDTTPVDAVELWEMLDVLEDKIKERKLLLRKNLLAITESQGTKLESGSLRLELAGATIEKQFKQAKEPDKDELIKLLGVKNIPLNQAFDEIPALVYNPSKIAFLVETGKISAAEIESLCAKQTALRVTNAKEFMKLFESPEKPAPKRVATRRATAR